MTLPFTRQELSEAGGRLVDQVAKKGMPPSEIAMLVLQFASCVAQIMQQDEGIWDHLPEEATAEQLLVIVFLMNYDRANGTDYLERLLSGEQPDDIFGKATNTTAEKSVFDWTLDDVTGFQA